jgi:4-amino-4-deoxy-L-arabinose transferase-like glycosyltransferase
MKTQSSALSPQSLLFLLLLSAYIIAGMALVPFHGDEATQIYMSHDYAYQFIQRDLSLVTYSDPPVSAQEQDLRLLNGTINKYLIGLAWHLGGFTADDLNEQWDWGGDWNYNQQNNHAPSGALLLVSRVPSALLLVAGLFAMFGLGWKLGGHPVAYLAALFYALHPVLLLNGRRAMMEGSFIAFSLLTVLAAVWWLAPSPLPPLPQGEGRRRYESWLAAIVLGVAAGLALASKHTAVFTVAAVFGACLLWVLFELRRRKGREDVGTRYIVSAVVQLVCVGVIALVIFYILNPAWWGDPLARSGQVLERRQELLTEQVTIFGGYNSMGDALAGFWRQVFVGQPQYYEVAGWESYLGDQIARYEASPWRGVTIGGSTAGGLILLVLVGFGIWALLRSKGIAASTRWLIGVWTLVMFATTALLTPLEWQRYYLPVIPAIGLLAALGVWWGVKRLKFWRG